MKFKFETGEIVECFDEAIAKILRGDSRYEELNAKTSKGRGKKAEEVKDETPIEDNIPENEVPKEDETPKGDESNDEVQE